MYWYWLQCQIYRDMYTWIDWLLHLLWKENTAGQYDAKLPLHIKIRQVTQLFKKDYKNLNNAKKSLNEARVIEVQDKIFNFFIVHVDQVLQGKGKKKNTGGIAKKRIASPEELADTVSLYKQFVCRFSKIFLCFHPESK